MKSLAPVLHLLRNGLEWVGVRWSLFDIQVIRRDFLHPHLPALLMRERELRP